MAIKLGALWDKESKTGNSFMSGSITIKGVETKIACFRNKYKEEGDNKPDWVIQESEPMTYNNNPRKVVNPKSRPQEIEDEDLPF